MENVVVRDGDEELSLFLEMRKLEKKKDQCASSLLKPGANSGDKTSTKSLVTTTTSSVQLRKSAVEKFLDSENNKSDYEWLLAVPDSLDEKEAKENFTVKLKEPRAAKSTALKPRVENIPQEPVTRSVKASKPVSRLNTSTTAISKQANTVAEPKPIRKQSRQATPTSRTTRLTNSARNSNPDIKTSSTKSNPRASSAFTRSSSVGKSVPSAAKSTTSLTIRELPARPVSTSRSRAIIRSKIKDDVNPVLTGTQLVERVVNMRKLPPPKQDDKTSSNFGRSLSRSSLDMALRHMNVRRSVSGNLRVTINSPTNSMDKNDSSPSS